MPSIKWHEVWTSPKSTMTILAISTTRTLQLIASRVIFPFRPRVLSLRNAIARVWVGTAFIYKATIFYSSPAQHDAQRIEGPGFAAYMIPTGKLADLKEADAVMLFMHGGGMILGHPLQYLHEYERWVNLAESKGKKIVIMAVHYPLSYAEKWPAQRSSVVAAYQWLLSQSVPATRIVFGGDSSGGNLALLTLLHIRDNQLLPQPACAVLQSPYLDMTGTLTIGSSNVETDIMFHFDDIVPVFNESLRPAGAPFDTPQISAILATDVGKLCPQLVFWSPTEILGSDSSRWINRSKAAGVDITEHVGHGEMHTYALGWPISGSKMQAECDQLTLKFILQHISLH